MFKKHCFFKILIFTKKKASSILKIALKNKQIDLLLELEDEIKYYLYKVGDVYSDITRGWRKEFQSQYSTLTLNSNHLIFVTHGGNYASNLTTSRKVDLTDYSKIYFEVDNYNINVSTMTTLDSMLLQRNDYGYTTSLCL